jgi:hypothetical protein
LVNNLLAIHLASSIFSTEKSKVPQETVDWAKEYFHDRHFKITAGSRDTLKVLSDPEVAAKNMAKMRY